MSRGPIDSELVSRRFAQVVRNELVVDLERFYQRDAGFVVKFLQGLGVELYSRFTDGHQFVFDGLYYDERYVKGALDEVADGRLEETPGYFRVAWNVRLVDREEEEERGPHLEQAVRLQLDPDVIIICEAGVKVGQNDRVDRLQ